MSLINPQTGQPFEQRKLTDQQIFQAFQALQAKLDALANQQFNSSILLEFIIEKMNGYVATDGQMPLEVSTEDFEAFFKARVEEIRTEMQEAMNQSVSQMGAAAPKVDLSE